MALPAEMLEKNILVVRLFLFIKVALNRFVETTEKLLKQLR